jgi:predicted phage baseplate assembly protein
MPSHSTPGRGVRSVTNPAASTGPADPDSQNEARKNAPLRVLTLDRIVSLKDFENFAVAFAAIGKAIAVPIWNGEKKIVRLIIAGVSGAIVDASTQTYTSLLTSIDEYKDPEIQVRIDSFTKKTFNVMGRLIVEKDKDPTLVTQAVIQALQDAFSFDARQFGQPVTRNEVIKSMQDVDGVVAADVDNLYLSTESEAANDIITCSDTTELLFLNPAPDAIDLQVTTQ